MKNLIHNDVQGFAAIFNKGECSLKQNPRPFAVDRWQNDEPRVKFSVADESPKVARILGDDHSVLGDAPCEHAMVRLPTSANVQGADRVVTACRVEPRR